MKRPSYIRKDGKTVGSLPKAQKGVRQPIYVSDKKDPRLKAYQDSLATYNLSKKIENIFDVNPADPRLEDYNRQAAALSKKTGIKPVTIKGSLGWTEPFRENLGPIEDMYMAKYKKPVQPVKYKKEEAPVKTEESSKIYTNPKEYQKALKAYQDSLSSYNMSYLDKPLHIFNPNDASDRQIMESMTTSENKPIGYYQVDKYTKSAAFKKPTSKPSYKPVVTKKEVVPAKVEAPVKEKTLEKYETEKLKKDNNIGWLRKDYGDYMRFQADPKFETYVDNSSPWLGTQYYVREKKKTGGQLSKSKAREILRDGTVHGNPLTDKQKRYFGWIAGGRKKEGGPIVTTEGFKMGPPPQGSFYRIPSDTLYNPTDYRIQAVANTGERKVLEPNTGDTTFKGAKYVDEYMMRKGGQLPKYQTDGEYIPFESIPEDPFERVKWYKQHGYWDKFAPKKEKPAQELKPENRPQPKAKKLETNQTINRTIKENVTLSPVSTYTEGSILNEYGRKQNLIRAEELRKQQELEESAEPSGWEAFKSAMDRGWGKYVTSEDEENIAPVDTTKKMVDIKKIPAQDRSVYGYKETRTVKDPYGPGVVFQNTFDNDKGGLYKIGYKVAELGVNPNAKPTYEGVEAVAHFLRDADVLDNQKLTKSVKTPTGKLTSKVANKYISYSDKEVTPDDYVMLYKKDTKNPENYRVKYKKYKEITPQESKEWQHDLPVKSYRFADIDWELVEPSKKTGWAAFGKSTKFVPLKSGSPSKQRWSTTYLPYKDSDAFSEYSGASVIYLFKDPVTGKKVGVDASGSINELRKAGEDIIKSYGVKPEDLTLAHHDTGSYSLKPKAQNNKLDYKQWKNFNQYNKGYSGAPLMIVKDWDKMKKGGSAKPKISYIRKDGRTVHK